jgi:hypothetical protein
MEDALTYDEIGPDPSNVTTADVDVLEPFGLGWRWKWRRDKTWVRMTFRGLRKGTSGPNAEITVEAGVPQVGVKGVLTVERLSLGDGRGRANLANRLSQRTGEGDDAAVSWRNLLDGICSRILKEQQRGPEMKVIGTADEKVTNWLVEGLVEEHQTTSIYGDGEVGKSWLGLAACVSLVSGVEIIPGWKPSRRVRALYLDWETDHETLNKRVRMICRGSGIPYTPIGYVSPDGPLADQVEWLLERVHDEGIEFLVIDSVEAAMAGSKSDGGDMNDAAAKVNQVLRKIGKSALLVDHVNAVNAQSKGLAGKAYGSIFKRNWVRISFEVKRVHDGTDGEKHVGVYCTKRNNGPRYDARGLRWTINEESTSWSQEDISEPELAAALPVKRRIEIVLGEDSPLSQTSIAERCEATLSSIRVELSRDKGKTFRRLPNDLWELVPAFRPRFEVVNPANDDGGELPWN